MTATDKLRELLDERGIKYQTHKSSTGTRFFLDYCEQCEDYLKSIEIIGSCIVASQGYLSPEQAIDIILERGTCHNTQTDFDFQCSECGQCLDNGRTLGVRYCPNCGAKVMD